MVGWAPCPVSQACPYPMGCIWLLPGEASGPLAAVQLFPFFWNPLCLSSVLPVLPCSLHKAFAITLISAETESCSADIFCMAEPERILWNELVQAPVQTVLCCDLLVLARLQLLTSACC